MNVLEAIVGFPKTLPGRQSIADLHIVGLAVIGVSAGHFLVMNIGSLGYDLRVLFAPDQVGGGDPFTIVPPVGQGDLVAVDRAAELQSVKLIGPGEEGD